MTGPRKDSFVPALPLLRKRVAKEDGSWIFDFNMRTAGDHCYELRPADVHVGWPKGSDHPRLRGRLIAFASRPDCHDVLAENGWNRP
jgi:hypothetical protein